MGGISVVSISLSGIAAIASSSACNSGVSGSGLPLFIFAPLMYLRLSCADDSSGSRFVLGPGMDDIEDNDSIYAWRTQRPPPFLVNERVRNRYAQRIAKGTFGEFEADFMLFKVLLRLFGVPCPAHRSSVYTLSYLPLRLLSMKSVPIRRVLNPGS